MPVRYKVSFADGSQEIKTLPVEVWQRGNSWTHEYQTNQEIIKVEIDPEKKLVDINSANDTWSSKDED